MQFEFHMSDKLQFVARFRQAKACRTANCITTNALGFLLTELELLTPESNFSNAKEKLPDAKEKFPDVSQS